MTHSGTAGKPDKPVGDIDSHPREATDVVAAMRAELAAISRATDDDQRAYHRARLDALKATTDEMIAAVRGEIDAELGRNAEDGQPGATGTGPATDPRSWLGHFGLGRKSRRRHR
ncbi:MAG TPA: hypothetical protein VHF26_20360 [Trebonia sp.]|jgi:hypothetical protein|nr:hypothetical protein [Trebonia sp.]